MLFSRFLSSTPLPFLFSGPQRKTEKKEKGYAYYEGATREPRYLSRVVIVSVKVRDITIVTSLIATYSPTY